MAVHMLGKILKLVGTLWVMKKDAQPICVKLLVLWQLLKQAFTVL